MNTEIKHGDALAVLRTMPDESVNCCVTSPPYWGLRDYGVEGQIGLEKTPEEFVAKMVAMFAEVRRVLRSDGTLWLNIGDSYVANATGGLSDKPSLMTGGRNTQIAGSMRPDKRGFGLKPKDLVGIPWMLAFALRADGWYLRQDIIWCLSGGAWVYARTQKGDMPIMVKDVVRLPTTSVQLWNGKKWTRVRSWTQSEGHGEKLELVLRSGERIGCTEGHYWPTQRGNVRASELKPGDVIDTCTLPDWTASCPNYLTHDALWLLGVYLAEGSKAGDTIQLSLHADEMGWLPKLECIAQHYGGSCTHTLDGNTLSVRMYGRVLNAMIDSYIGGTDAATKHLKVAAWMLPNTGLRSLVSGYLAGDGHCDSTNNRHRLGFTRNYSLERDLRVLAARLGATLTLRPGTATGFGKQWKIFKGEWRWDRSGHANEKPRSEVLEVRRSRARKFWDIEVEDEPHVFALASGVLTHNSKPNPMPESVTDRCTKAHEYLFMLSKSARYYYDQAAILEDVAESQIGRFRANDPIGGKSHAEGGQHSPGGLYSREGKNSRMHQDRDPAHPETRKVRSPAGWKTGNGAHGSVHDEGREREVSYAEIEGTKRNKRSVWEIATQPFPEAHFATFPEDLVRPCILAGCPNGGVVLDPFMGSGTTLLVARKNNCHGIGIELSAEYIEIAQRRLRQECFSFREGQP